MIQVKEMENYYNKYSEKIMSILRYGKGNDEHKIFYKKNTIYSAIIYIIRIKKKMNELNNSIAFPDPTMFPGAYGKIELEWSEDKYDIQITIPTDTSEKVSIYAIFDDDEYVKTLDFNEDVADFVKWLIQKLSNHSKPISECS